MMTSFLLALSFAGAAKALAKTGAEIVAPPESFFIVRHGPIPQQTLEPGEITRAEAWGRAVATAGPDRTNGRYSAPI